MVFYSTHAISPCRVAEDEEEDKQDACSPFWQSGQGKEKAVKDAVGKDGRDK